MPEARGSEVTGAVANARATAAWPGWLLLVYCISGITGVAYEVLWVRMLAIQFGASNFGVVVTLLAFMGGLGAGGLAGAHLARRFTAPLLAFAAIEAGVAVIALSLPWLFGTLDGLLAGTLGHAPLATWFALQATVSFAVLFVPAFALGFAFPLVLRTFQGTRTSIVSIYGLNTLGGALGALLPLVLLPMLGWTTALRVVAGIGLAVACAAVVLARSVPPRELEGGIRSASPGRPDGRSLLVYAGIGAAALMLQVGWTRLFGTLLLRTEYVLAIILFVFLAGLGLGSLLARRVPPAAALAGFPLAAGTLALLTLWGLPTLAWWADHAEFASLASALTLQGVAVAALTLPTTLILGAWLPILSGHLADRSGSLAGAWLYGANSIGAGIGAAIAGFALIPAIGTTGTLCLAALLVFIFGMYWCRPRAPWLALPVLAALAWPWLTLPEAQQLLPRTQAGSVDLMVDEDALSMTHVLEQPDGQRLLLSDLRWMDASTEHTAVEVQKNQARLALLLHPDPRSALLLGLGTGITAAGALPFPDLELTSVELSTGAIRAARSWFAPVNGGVMDSMEVVRDDVKRFLRADNRAWDVIIGDLFHPDLVGRSNLLSIQQFERVRARLADGGVFVQWLALNQFDPRSLETVMRGFAQVFPDNAVFLDGFRLALAGATRPFSAPAVLANASRLDPGELAEATGGEGLWTWLGRYQGPIRPGAGPVEDEWAPRIEFSLPRARFAGGLQVDALLDRLLAMRPDVEEAADLLKVDADSREAFERAYIATELAMRAWVLSFDARATEPLRLMQLAGQANPLDRWAGFYVADRMYESLDAAIARGIDRRAALERILEIRPDHTAALEDLWRHVAETGDSGEAEMLFRRLRILSPLDRDVRQSGLSGPGGEEGG